MLYTYSVTPLVEDHFGERVADLIDQHRRGISTCPLFSCIIQPQGDPVWHAGARIAAIYARYKERLDEAGVPSGLLLQSTLGHGTAAMAPAHIVRLDACGNEVDVAFERNADGFYTLDVACEPLYPTLLLIRQ